MLSTNDYASPYIYGITCADCGAVIQGRVIVTPTWERICQSCSEEPVADLLEIVIKPILDNTDIDDNGNGIETGICCVACKEETVARYTITGWYRVGLSCEHCLETLVEWAA